MSRKEAILNIHQILVIRRDALRKALAGDFSQLAELRSQTSGNDHAELASVSQEIDAQLAEIESRELARIESALERMREGLFGVCEGCGTAISTPRLNALPYATYCIKCQREQERQSETSAPQINWDEVLGPEEETDLSIDDFSPKD